jgi:FkbM family methyltransferase
VVGSVVKVLEAIRRMLGSRDDSPASGAGPATRRHANRDHVTFSTEMSGQPFSRLYVDTKENRGLRILRRVGETQPDISRLWRAAVTRIAPDVALDIGANYGEISIGATYPTETKVLLFEPNPNLQPFLQRSIASHVDKARITLIEAAVGPERGTVQIHYDRKWSGTSSIVRKPQDRGWKGKGELVVETLPTAVVAIDDVLAERKLSAKRLLFKMDVEGYEWPALAGMIRSLESSNFLGIVEISNFKGIAKASRVKEILAAGTFFRTDNLTSVQLTKSTTRSEFGTDFIFTNEPDWIELLRAR